MSKTRRRIDYDDDSSVEKGPSFLPVCDDSRHLVCIPYSVDNLHLVAKELGIGNSWFHGGRLPHYDIPKKRRDDIEAQCMKVNSRQIVRIIRGVQIDFSE